MDQIKVQSTPAPPLEPDSATSKPVSETAAGTVVTSAAASIPTASEPASGVLDANLGTVSSMSPTSDVIEATNTEGVNTVARAAPEAAETASHLAETGTPADHKPIFSRTQADAIITKPEDIERSPLVNLLQNRDTVTGTAAVATPKKHVAPVKKDIPPLVVPGSPVTAAGAKSMRSKSWLVPIGGVALLLVVSVGAIGFSQMSHKQVAKQTVATPQTTPVPLPSSSSTPEPEVTATPAPTPAPTPVPTIVPQTVTAPIVAPTTDNPQSVIVQSKSGIWLRSSASSANQKNVISWIPNGASVSVDRIGDFWWHGVYRGKIGYFASKYTQ